MILHMAGAVSSPLKIAGRPGGKAISPAMNAWIIGSYPYNNPDKM